MENGTGSVALNPRPRCPTLLLTPLSLAKVREREREHPFPRQSGDGIERRIIFEFSKAIKREREGDKAEGRGLSKWLRGWRRAGVME